MHDIKGLVESIKGGKISDLIPLFDLLNETNDWRLPHLTHAVGGLFVDEVVPGCAELFVNLDGLFWLETHDGWENVKAEFANMEHELKAFNKKKRKKAPKPYQVWACAYRQIHEGSTRFYPTFAGPFSTREDALEVEPNFGNTDAEDAVIIRYNPDGTVTEVFEWSNINRTWDEL